MDNASKKWTRPVLVIAAAVILVIVVLVTRSPDVPPAPEEAITMGESVEQPEDLPDTVFPEVVVYAEHYGITVDEALRRFEVQDAFAGLDTELSIKEPDTFAGLYIQHEPDFHIVALFTRDGEETMKPYVPEGLAEYVEVRTVAVSYRELQSAQNEVSSALRSLGIPADSGIDVKENRVKFNVTDVTPVSEAISEGTLAVPGYVVFTEIEGLAQPD